MTDEEIFIVSDLHLGDGEGEAADRIVGDRARHFASFVRWLAENVGPATPRRLVLPLPLMAIWVPSVRTKRASLSLQEPCHQDAELVEHVHRDHHRQH